MSKNANSVDAKIRKRSVVIDGKKTSISLEGPFWRHLVLIAESGDRSVSALVGIIKAAYPETNLSSACRLYVLADAVAGAQP